MTFKVGISEKKLADKRFKRTEEKILRLFFEDEKCLEMKTLAEKVGVTRSTVYRHHRAARNIVLDYEVFVLRSYIRMVKRNSHLSVRLIFLKTLYFVINKEDVFKVLMKYCEERIFYKMIIGIDSQMMKKMKLPRNAYLIYVVYASEVARLVYEWGKNGFLEDEIEVVLDRIMFLTMTARVRLKVLLK
ncbi:HTH domain-containing protein [Candidatus Saccharibacteria bacterium]|nr:HTH domain-containing protein [Candidatus Saccharibacteria bacterium]